MEREGEGERHTERQTDRERDIEREREMQLCAFVTKGQNCSCDRQLNKLKIPRTVQITMARRGEKRNTIALRYITVCLQTRARPMGPKYCHSRDNHIKHFVLHPLSRLVPFCRQRSLSYTESDDLEQTSTRRQAFTINSLSQANCYINPSRCFPLLIFKAFSSLCHAHFLRQFPSLLRSLFNIPADAGQNGGQYSQASIHAVWTDWSWMKASQCLHRRRTD